MKAPRKYVPHGAVVSRDEYRAGDAVPIIARPDLDKWRWETMQRNYAWRKDASLDEDYYDGNQLSAEVLQRLEERGIPAIVCNMIGPTVDVIIGMEARTRTDYVVRPNGKGWDEVAEAMGQDIKDAERLSGCDEACSEAYERQVKAGIGWVEVARESDPFRYPYRVRHRDWREFRLDPFSVEYDISDARYLRRVKFYERERLLKLFPKQAEQIAALGGNVWGGGAYGADSLIYEPEMLSRGDAGPWRDYSLVEREWLDYDNNRLELEEIWYRVWVRGNVMRTGDGQVLEYDDRNPIHAEAANRGIVQVESRVYTMTRVAFWIGPLRIDDQPSPYPHRDFPYVPFWGMREARTGVPYGVVRRMRPMQDEINARRSKMLWALSARRVFATKGSVDDHDEAREEASRPDAYFILSANQNESFKVDDNQGISQQQFEAYQDAKQMLQDCGGVFQAQLGKEMTGQSGVAIANLVEQGTQTLAAVNRRFRAGRQKVGELLMAMRIQDIANKGEHEVIVQNSAGEKRTVVLNKRVQGQGADLATVENDVRRANLQLVLDELPSTPTFRLQQMERIAELVGKLPPDMQIQMLDMVVEASDVPNKAEFIKRIRGMLGNADPESMTPEERAKAEAQQQAQQQQQEIEQRAAMAKIARDEAAAQLEQARAQQVMASIQEAMAKLQTMVATITAANQQTAAKTQLTAAQTEKTQAETRAIEQDIASQAAALADGPPDKQVATYRW